MHLKYGMLSASVLLMCSFASSYAAESTNIVFNGNFAGGVQPNTGTNTIANGWGLLPAENSSFQIENIGGNFYAAFMSTASAADLAEGYMNGIGVPNGQPDQDCFYQVLTVVAGKQYTVSFSVQVTGTVGSNTLLIPQWNWNPQVGAQLNMMDSLYGSYEVANGEYSPANGTGSVNVSFIETAPVGEGVSEGSLELVNLMFHGSDVSGGTILLSNVVVTEDTGPPRGAPHGMTPRTASIPAGGVVRGTSSSPIADQLLERTKEPDFVVHRQ